MPSKYLRLLPSLATSGVVLGLAVLASCVDTGRDRADETEIAAGLAGVEAIQAGDAASPRRHRRHARGLAMPYFSFAQSLRPRN